MTAEVLQVVQEFSRQGGVETVAFELDAAFRFLGMTTAVLTGRAENAPPQSDLSIVAPALARIPTRGRWRYVGRLVVIPLFTLAATWRLRKAGRESVVISHGDTLGGDILVVHGINSVSIREKIRAGSFRWMLNPMHIWVMARDKFMIGGVRFRRYVAVSTRAANDLADAYRVPRNRIRVISNGINPARFTPDGEGRAAVRAEFAIPLDAKLLLFAGHEFDRKGLSFVIEALAALDPTVHLLVVGSDDRDAYVRLAKKHGVEKRVVFAGHRDDLPRCYRAADIFVLPTAYETFSLVCMEALACGVPVLATAVGGTEDYIENGVNGFLIERDAGSIEMAAKRVFADPANFAAMRANALKTSAGFAWNEIAIQYRTLIEEVARERGLPRPREVAAVG